MNIQTNKVYQSELIAHTDLHAGGVFFGIVYSKCLKFESDGQVTLTNKIVDPFRPMDPSDLTHLENYKATGKYSVNDRGYLICDFKEIFTTFTGMFSIYNTDRLIFNIYDDRLKKIWSEIYS